MDYTAVGHTTHLAARMEQMAMPGSILVSAATRELADGYVSMKALGPRPVKGLAEAVEVYELSGVGPAFAFLDVRGQTIFIDPASRLVMAHTAVQKHAVDPGAGRRSPSGRVSCRDWVADRPGEPR